MSSRPPDHSIPLSEPVTNITYAGRLLVWSYLLADNELHSGLASYNPTSLQVPVKDLSWSYQTNGQKEELYGSDFSWTKLTLLEPRPHLAFAAQPAMNVILPAGSDAHTLFRVSGSPAGGSVPIFVRILLYPALALGTSDFVGNRVSPSPRPLCHLCNQLPRSAARTASPPLGTSVESVLASGEHSSGPRGGIPEGSAGSKVCHRSGNRLQSVPPAVKIPQSVPPGEGKRRSGPAGEWGYGVSKAGWDLRPVHRRLGKKEPGTGFLSRRRPPRRRARSMLKAAITDEPCEDPGSR